MAVNNPVKITDDTKLSELTVGDLKTILREVVEDIVEFAVLELQQQLPDPDAGKKLKPEIARRLWQSMNEGHDNLLTMEEVKRELGLDE
jgi:hypothetical protein